MSSSIIQRSFAAGEIGPALYARADQVKYQTGLKTCRNFIVMRHGGVTNRPGTEFIAEVKDSAARTYLTKFVFNDSQTYVIELGNQYARFYRDGAQIVVSGVAAYNGATAYVPGNLVESGGVNYYCKAATTGNAPPNATYWHPLTGTIFEIPTSYVTADLSTLRFVQSGDVVTITHPNYPPAELARTGHTAWTLTTISFAPSISAPTGTANTGAVGTATAWKVTAVKSDTYEESLASNETSSSATPSSGSPITVSWGAVSGAVEYNVYKQTGGVYGFIGVSTGLSFVDNGITADQSITPPVARTPFGSASNYPSVAGYFQQRRFFANTDNEPEKVWGTKTGTGNNLTISSPLQDEDAVTFSLKGRKVNEIMHMAEIDDFVVLTAGGEWAILGDSDGVLRATAPANAKQKSYHGSSEVAPAIIGNNLIYLQARGTILRDFRQDLSQGAQSRDLSIFSPHLFVGMTIERMDYQQVPHSIVWAARSDGALLGMTYLRDHEVWGWHRHDTNGGDKFEDVVCVPEGTEDAVYSIVNRTVGGATKRYIERFASRVISTVAADARFLDSHLTYDGRVTGGETVTLTSAGGGWTHDDEITVTRSSGGFVSGDVGNAVHARSGDDQAEIVIGTYVSATVVRGYPRRDVPASLRGVASSDWGRAVDMVSGLDHLEGRTVGILADGNALTQQTVTSGDVTSLGRQYEIIHVGLPIEADVETLDLDVDGEQIRDSRKRIGSVSLLVEDTRGGFVGPDADNLTELKVDDVIGTALQTVTGIKEINIAATWRQSGSFFVRQSDPLPMTILAAIPNGTIGG
jgi:hypothetical protein